MSGSYCSLVGDPKTGLTIVSQRRFLKFITVMIDIQRMDRALLAPIPVGAELARESDLTVKQLCWDVLASSRASSAPTRD
jgi:hypothetical protein